MSKMQRNIAILCVVLILLLGAAVLFEIVMPDNNQNAQSKSIIYISNYSVGSVTKIEIENEHGSLVLIQEDGMWYAKNHEDANLDQGVVNEIAYMFTHITGERNVSDREDEENLYGMLTPSAKIMTQHEGVLEQVFIIGDKAPLKNEYYMQSNVYKEVYTVDSTYYTFSQIKLEDLLELKGIGINHGNLKKLHIKNSLGEEYTIRRTDDINDYSLCYWEFTAPFNHDLDTAILYGTEDYLGMITHITELVSEKALGYVDADDEEYGLNNPIYYMDIYDHESVVQSITIGDYGDEKYYSISFGDENVIYAVSKGKVPFVDYSIFMLADGNLNLINFDAVNSVTVDMPELRTVFNVVKLESANSEGNEAYDVSINVEGLDESVLSANINEQKIMFYQELVTIKIDDILLGYDVTDKVGSIVFGLDSSYRSEYTVEFYEYSKTHYLAIKNGEDAGYLVSKKEIDRLAQSYHLLLSGKLKQEN